MKKTPTFKAYFRWKGKTVFEEISLSEICYPVDYSVQALSMALRKYTQHYTRLCMLVSEAEFFLKQARYTEHCIREDLYAEYKDGGVKQTETWTKNQVSCDSRMRDGYEARMEAAARLNQVKAALTAVQERGRVLQSLCANIRTEINAGYKE